MKLEPCTELNEVSTMWNEENTLQWNTVFVFARICYGFMVLVIFPVSSSSFLAICPFYSHKGKAVNMKLRKKNNKSYQIESCSPVDSKTWMQCDITTCEVLAPNAENQSIIRNWFRELCVHWWLSGVSVDMVQTQYPDSHSLIDLTPPPALWTPQLLAFSSSALTGLTGSRVSKVPGVLKANTLTMFCLV